MTIPIQDLLAILPELVVIGTACLILVLDPILRIPRRTLLAWLTLQPWRFALVSRPPN